MYQEILAIIEFFGNVFYYVFYYSFIIGQFLVGSTIEALQILMKIVSVLTGVYYIVRESFTFFFRDVEQLSQAFLRFLTHLCRDAGNSIAWTIQKISNSIEEAALFISMVSSSLSNSFYTTVATMGAVFLFCKQAVVLFGTNVWFVLTFIPFSIWDMIIRISSFLEEFHKKAFDFEAICLNVCKNVYTFLTDVPVQSALGLVAAACIGYVLNEIYATIFSVLYDELRDAILNIYENFKRRIVSLRRPILRLPPEHSQNPVSVNSVPIQPPIQGRATQTSAAQPSLITPRKRPLIRESNRSRIAKHKVSEELYCVICQEHVKCILLLPCRHVCMCFECNSRLQLYTDTCPICRIHIESTMQIFI